MTNEFHVFPCIYGDAQWKRLGTKIHIAIKGPAHPVGLEPVQPFFQLDEILPDEVDVDPVEASPMVDEVEWVSQADGLKYKQRIYNFILPVRGW